MAFERGDRTYYVSDERPRAFRSLPVEERLRWVEEEALFLRLPRETPAMPRDARSRERKSEERGARHITDGLRVEPVAAIFGPAFLQSRLAEQIFADN